RLALPGEGEGAALCLGSRARARTRRVSRARRHAEVAVFARAASPRATRRTELAREPRCQQAELCSAALVGRRGGERRRTAARAPAVASTLGRPAGLISVGCSAARLPRGVRGRYFSWAASRGQGANAGP